MCAIDGDSSRKYFAGEDATYAGAHAEGFVDTGAEVAAAVEFGAASDLFRVSECGVDFADDSFETAVVVEEVEECACDCCRCGVCA